MCIYKKYITSIVEYLNQKTFFFSVIWDSNPYENFEQNKQNNFTAWQYYTFIIRMLYIIKMLSMLTKILII